MNDSPGLLKPSEKLTKLNFTIEQGYFLRSWMRLLKTQNVPFFKNTFVSRLLSACVVFTGFTFENTTCYRTFTLIQWSLRTHGIHGPLMRQKVVESYLFLSISSLGFQIGNFKSLFCRFFSFRSNRKTKMDARIGLITPYFVTIFWIICLIWKVFCSIIIIEIFYTFFAIIKIVCCFILAKPNHT